MPEFSDHPVHFHADTHRYLDNTNALVTVGYSEIPREAIISFNSNPKANALLDQRFHELISPEFLMQRASFAVPLEKAQHKKLMSYESGRTLEGVLKSKLIPYGNSFLGGLIDQKGGFLSGAHYQRELDYDNVSNSPLGFINLNHAKTAQYVTNELISFGFRSQLVLGSATLNKNVVFEWMKKQNYPSSVVKRAEEDIFDRVKDELAIYWRLGGVSSRFDTLVSEIDGLEQSEMKKSIEKRQKTHRDFIRAARIFYEESVLFPEVFNQHFATNEEDQKEKTKQVLFLIASRRPLDFDQFQLLKKYYALLLIQNVKAMKKLFKSDTSIYRLSSFTNESDIDLSLCTYDFENTIITTDSETKQLTPARNSFSSLNAQKYIETLGSFIEAELDKHFSRLFNFPSVKQSTLVPFGLEKLSAL